MLALNDQKQLISSRKNCRSNQFMMETPPGLSRLTRKVVAQRVQRTLGGTRVLVEDLKHRYKNRKRLNWLLTQPAGGLEYFSSDPSAF
jgi:hypothetical protein